MGFCLIAAGLDCNNSQIGGNGNNGNNGNNDGGNGSGSDGGTGGDGGQHNYGDGGLAAYCAGSGPPISVSDSSGGASRCTGDIAATAFRYALCVCNAFSASQPIRTDAFDSSDAGAMTFGTGGSVGVNTNINFGTMSVGGTLQVQGSVVANQGFSTGADLLTAGGLNANAAVTVGGNANIGDNITINGTFTGEGKLTYPAGKTLTTQNTSFKQGVATGPVNVGAPCDCNSTQLFNVPGYVDARKTDNDNAAGNISAGQLVNYNGDQSLTFDCGRFYLDRIGGNGKVTFQVNGRTALFVGGDVNLNGGFTVNLGPQGELDLFIKGSLVSSSSIALGNPSQPAKVRLYMGSDINLSGASTIIGGNLYAPKSGLTSSGSLTVYGAIFVSSFNPSAAVNIHHDIAIIKAADSCHMPTGGGGTPACASCQDCGSQACKAGHCAPCTSNADCCAPLTCNSKGYCYYIIG